jgi:hypothetical protein
MINPIQIYYCNLDDLRRVAGADNEMVNLNNALHIYVDVATQLLTLWQDDTKLREYLISTAKNGVGQCRGSGCTPLGRHRIRLRIGHDCPINTVFIGRRATGEIYNQELAAKFPERDWILTRILWLTGIEYGYNRGGQFDTLRRYIYIHGCPDVEPMGIARSHGCIRMRNAELVELFNLVNTGTLVVIK